MKVLLIHSPALFRERTNKRINTKDIRVMPVGLVAIANFLLTSGVDAEVVHVGIEIERNQSFRIESFVSDGNYDIVGISIHWHKQLNSALEIARKIKRANPKVFIVLGGYTASFFAGELVSEYKFLDAVIQGDGELPVLRLVQELEKAVPELSNVPNLFWRRQGETIQNQHYYAATASELDSLDFADFRVLRHYKDYITMESTGSSEKNNTMFYLVNGRGCPYQCSFCGGSRKSHKMTHHRDGFILQSPEAVIRTIKSAVQLGWENFYMCFDPVPRGDYYVHLFNMIQEEGLDISMMFGSWGLPARRVIDGLAKSFRQAWVELSPETYSERVRKLNKGIFYTNKQLNETVDYLVEKGVGVCLYFGYFLPFETLDEIIDTLAYILLIREQHRDLVKTFFIPYSLDPGSPQYLDPDRFEVHTRAKSVGDYIKRIGYYRKMNNTENMILSHPSHFSPEEALRIHHLIQFEWYLDNAYPLTTMLLRRAYSGGYKELLQHAYNRLARKSRKNYALQDNETKNIMQHLIEIADNAPPFLHDLFVHEYQSFANNTVEKISGIQ